MVNIPVYNRKCSKQRCRNTLAIERRNALEFLKIYTNNSEGLREENLSPFFMGNIKAFYSKLNNKYI